MIVHGQGLCCALALIITASYTCQKVKSNGGNPMGMMKSNGGELLTDGVDIAPVGLGLRML